MTDEGPKGLTMIGLHRLVAGKGDAMVPELYQMLAERDAAAALAANIIVFPSWAARPAGEAPSAPLGPDAAGGRNVIAFVRPSRKTSVRRKTS